MKRRHMPPILPSAVLVLIALAGCGGDGAGAGDAQSGSAAGGEQGGAGGAPVQGSSSTSGVGQGGASTSGAGQGSSSTSGAGQGGASASGAGQGGATTSVGSSTSSGDATTGSDASSTASTSATTGAGGAPPSCDYPDAYQNGSITFYTLDMGSAEVNCSYEIKGRNPDVIAHVPFGGGQYFGAMNTADYNAAAMCGACVEVTRDDGRSVQAMIVDQCPIATNPKCTRGHIDLSKSAFLQIGQEHEGYLGTTNGGAAGKISWKYVPCPTTENVTFRLKDATNRYWNEIIVEGHRHPIAKLEVQVNGTWQTATRQSYNYFIVGDGNMGPAPYHVRVTDINGSIVEAALELRAGPQTASAQFPACQ